MVKYLNLFSNCVIVKGSIYSILCDLQNAAYFHFNNDVAEVIDLLATKSIKEVIKIYGKDNENTILEYVNLIVVNNLGFIDDSIIKELTSLDLNWDHYSNITNAIVEIGNFEIENFTKFIRNLTADALEIRCFDIKDLSKVYLLMSLLQDSSFISIKLIIPYDIEFVENIGNIIRKNLRVHEIFIFGCPDNMKIESFELCKVHILSSKEFSNNNCGVIKQDYFSPNISMFTESHHFNNCLNRKLSIDKDGLICNCPSSPERFGNINDNTVEDILSNISFTNKWKIKKDDIEICKDCEFRYICSDCRVFLEDPSNIYSKPLKCGYNPYTGEWGEWSKNPLKQKAIKHYGLQEYIKK